MIIIPFNSNSQGSGLPAKEVAYVSHAPIVILGDADFTNATGVTWGDGTIIDPYIIEGWKIHANSSQNAISITNTTLPFIIRNCVMNNASDKEGVHLSNVTNGKLEGNLCENNLNGIGVYYSHNSTITGNVCRSNGQFGILLIQSHYNEITNNECTNNSGLNTGIGIFLGSSDRNSIVGNTCNYHSSEGIHLTQSNYNNITDNVCDWNYFYGIFILKSAYNNMSGDSCTNNQKGGIVLEESAINAVRNCTVDKTFEMYGGIRLIFANFNTIINCTVTDTILSGISLGSSNNNSILENTCWYDEHGITLDSSLGNIILNNSCSHNRNSGIAVYSWSDGNILSDNICNYNSKGIDVASSSNNIMTNNTLLRNKAHGLIIEYPGSIGNRVWNNTFYQNDGDQAFDSGVNNNWDNSRGHGNYWSDWLSPDNIAPFGIVDLPYNISGGPQDMSPLTASPREIENTSPEASLHIAGTPGNNSWYLSNVTISLTASDTDSGIKFIRYCINEIEWHQYVTPIVIAQDGNYTFEFSAADPMGNSKDGRVIVRIDQESPISSLNKTDSTLTINAYDVTSSVNSTLYRIDNGTWKDYMGPMNFAIEGNHSVDFYSTDIAGNSEHVKTVWVDNGYGTPWIIITGLIIAIIIGSIVVYIVIIKKGSIGR